MVLSGFHKNPLGIAQWSTKSLNLVSLPVKIIQRSLEWKSLIQLSFLLGILPQVKVSSFPALANGF